MASATAINKFSTEYNKNTLWISIVQLASVDITCENVPVCVEYGSPPHNGGSLQGDKVVNTDPNNGLGTCVGGAFIAKGEKL